MERLVKFYKHILRDINTYSQDEEEKSNLVSRLNTYLSFKTDNVDEVTHIINEVLEQEKAKNKTNKGKGGDKGTIENGDMETTG